MTDQQCLHRHLLRPSRLAAASVTQFGRADPRLNSPGRPTGTTVVHQREIDPTATQRPSGSKRGRAKTFGPKPPPPTTESPSAPAATTPPAPQEGQRRQDENRQGQSTAIKSRSTESEISTDGESSSSMPWAASIAWYGTAGIAGVDHRGGQAGKFGPRIGQAAAVSAAAPFQRRPNGGRRPGNGRRTTPCRGTGRRSNRDRPSPVPRFLWRRTKKASTAQ